MIKRLFEFTLPLFTIFISVVLFSCKGQQIKGQEGTLNGTIGIYEGNCMPGPGVTPCEPRPITTTVYITQPSKEFSEELIVTAIESDKDGQYTVNLKPGTYSLFLKDGENTVCDLIQCPDACYCHPFTIVADSTVIIDANLDHATW